MRRRDRQAFQDVCDALAKAEEYAEQLKTDLLREQRNVGDLSLKLLRLEAGVEPMRRRIDSLLAGGKLLAEQLDVDAIRELSDAVDRFVPTEEMKSNLGALAAVAAGDLGQPFGDGRVGSSVRY